MPRTKSTRRVRRKTKDPVARRSYVKRQISRNIETKHYVNSSTPTDISTTIGIQNLTSSIIQGDDTDERDGNTVKLTRISGRIFMERDNSAATGSTMNSRVLLVQWHRDTANEDLTQLSDIFETTTDTTLTTLSGYRLNKAARSKFTVLMDKQVTLTASTDGAWGHYKTWGFAVNSNRLRKTEWTSSGTDALNHVFLIYVSNQATGNENGIITWVANIHYKDI